MRNLLLTFLVFIVWPVARHRAGVTAAKLSVADVGAVLGDQGIPYFFGIIDDANTFTRASVTTIGGGFFLYNVDDITTANKSIPTGCFAVIHRLACGSLISL